MEDKLKMYCIFSKESLKAMGGNRGKMAAQAGHAYLHAFWNSQRQSSGGKAAQYQHSEHAYKICLVAETNEELETLYQHYKQRYGATLVVDQAFTVLDKPQLTCIGIGPIFTSEVGSDLKKLKVLI